MVTSDDAPHIAPCYQDERCPKCGAGFLILQTLDVYDGTYYGDDTDYLNGLFKVDNEESFIGLFYRYHCSSCGYNTLIYDDAEDLREVWRKEHKVRS